MKTEPAWTALPAGTPPGVRRVIERCLRKDPKRRARDIGDVALDLEDALCAADAAEPSARVSPRSWMAPAGWAAAALFALIAGVISFMHFRETGPAPATRVRFQIPPPDKVRFTDSAPVVSPDGRRVAAYARGDDGRTMIWVRALDSLEARPLAGTEGRTVGMFWSPDSRYLAFVAGDQMLKKVDASGGPPETICPVRGYRGGAWSPRGVIVFGDSTGLVQVPAAGGTAAPLTTLGANEIVHGWPAFLPDGRRFLYLRASAAPIFESAGVYVGSLDVAPDRQDSRRLLTVQSNVLYAPLGERGAGCILFARETTLLAQPFDAQRLETTGDPFPLPESVAAAGAAFSASATGVLVYRSTRDEGMSQLLWLDAQGKRLGQVGPPARYGDVALAPDGKTLAVDQTGMSEIDRGPDRPGVHVWTVDLAREVVSRLNPESAGDLAPQFSPDGRIAFTRAGDLYTRLASGAGEPELLVKSDTMKHANDWSPDGRFLLYDDHHPSNRQDLWILPMSGDRKPVPFLTTPADEAPAHFSPDGRWVAYSSDESGRREVHVRDFAPDRVPAVGSGRWQISIAGGDKPRWSRDGKQIYYLAPDRKLMAVPVRTSPKFEPGKPVPLFETHVAGFFPFDVAPDGRFLINTLPDPATLPSLPITVVLNWTAGFKK